ncbi:hypothetical protein DSO57_1031117 [Entomophthora muscae]|uniref:Uncharacterized protein n=1 Tax=Entomophthora muscae TaxID=34485 RepID=A0ACC2RRN7_9FUNG|nr:hypothetical protein DSO57_1031117 [Entomophthora muscae]
MNSPIPTDLAAECTKAAKILNKFIDPKEAGIDSVVPHDILTKAKGFAILTIIKAGFVWSGRAGSGLVVARLSDGSWSAPSGIGSAGVGFGGQIGAQITDFLIILNTADAVKAFSEGGNVTLGGNLSVAAGPLGRSAEAGGAVAHFAAIYSYSKSKGLFAGVSIEGSVILERKDANAKFYGRQVRAKELLSGKVPPPGQAAVLYQALNDRAAGIPSPTCSGPSRESSTYNPDTYGRSHNRTSSASAADPSPPSYSPSGFNTVSADSKRSPPPIPNRPGRKQTAVALYDYEASQESDLSFHRGDIITIEKKTESLNDWWKGSLNGQVGDFPSNYVELQ